MKRFILFGLLGGLLATNAGCGLLQAIFCCHPVVPVATAWPATGAIVATRAAGRDAGRRLVAAVRLVVPAAVPMATWAAAAGAVRLAEAGAAEVAARATILVPIRVATAATAVVGIVDR